MRNPRCQARHSDQGTIFAPQSMQYLAVGLGALHPFALQAVVHIHIHTCAYMYIFIYTYIHRHACAHVYVCIC